ncbi:2-oxo acid dehydrogenase subunit E2 [Planococcus sp. APC 4015]|nr:2-oxo acid dehydrogenase subunit E2 [Planococcus sp. APC 4015]
MSVVRMPEVATGAAEAAIQVWLVKVGDDVTAGQPIVEIETEKAVIEYEAEESGVLAAILLDAGVGAAVGTPIAVLATGGETADAAIAGAGVDAATPATASAEQPQPPVQQPAAAPPTRFEEPDVTGAPVPVAVEFDAPAETGAAAEASQGASPRLFASPLVRRLARERGLDLATIRGSGPQGRVVRRDLDGASSPTAAPTAPPTAAEPAAAPAPAERAASAATGEWTDIPHTGMRRAIARRLTESTSTVPHFFLTADCVVDEVLALRARINDGGAARISVNDFVIAAVAAALRDVPEVNAIWTDDAIRRFTGVDIAVAVSVPGGLVTPVLRGVERLRLGEISSSVRELAERGRAGRLKQSELEGGSFSISNLGMYGTKEFSAIINPPHSGILAVGAAEKRAVVGADGQPAVATVMTVTLSADHRVVDGALGAQWLAAFVSRVQNPLSLLV